MNVIEFAFTGEHFDDERPAIRRIRLAVDNDKLAIGVNFANCLGSSDPRGSRAYDGVAYVEVVWH